MWDVSRPRLVVSAEALADDDAAVVESFGSVVEVLLDEGLDATHFADGALAAYYTDRYAGQLGNGGFAQFLWNGGREPRILLLVRDGLARFGGEAHEALFERFVAGWERLSPAERAGFAGGALFGANPLRDRLGGPDDDYFALQARDPLAVRLAAWLRAHPDLLAVRRAQLRRYVSARTAAVRDGA